MVHKFNESLQYGEGIETMLDAFFSKWFMIEPVTPDLQRLGVDRIFTMNRSKQRFSVEYKADRQAHDTGNAYIETVSVYRDGEIVKFGWANTSIAQRVLYYIEGPRRVYILDLHDIRDMLPKWEKVCKKVDVENEDYSGSGLLVPLTELETMARGRMVVSD